MDNRSNATCPECGGSVTIIPSPCNFQMAVWCYLKTHDGRILNSRQDPHGVPPPRIPTPEMRDKDIAVKEAERNDS